MKAPRHTRREMMLNSARAVGGLGVAASLRCFGPLLASAAGGFKIGVCDWSVGKTSDPAAFEIAKNLGLDGVQVSLGSLRNDMHLRKPEVQDAFRKAAKEHGVEIASLGIGELNPFFSRGDLRDDEKGIDTVVERLKRVAPKAEKAGVILGLESYLSARQHMDIIEGVGSRAVQVYYDVGNSHDMGYDIYEEIRFLGNEQICEFHAKDGKSLFGKGEVDFKEVRRAMDDIGYRGWIQMEGAQPLGMEKSYRHNAEYLRGIFPPAV